MPDIENVRLGLLGFSSGAAKFNGLILFVELIFINFDKVRVTVVGLVEFIT